MWVDRVVRWLLPKEDQFFEILEELAACALRGAGLLVECCNAETYNERETISEQIRQVEHDGDRSMAKMYQQLNKSFVTPLDREDLYALANALEGISDDIYSTALQITVHAMEDLPDGSSDMAHLIKRACDEIVAGVALLRTHKSPAEVQRRCRAIKRIEEEADDHFRRRIAEMFRIETNAIRLVKHKEFLEGMEQTVDACDDVGSVLESIAIKHA